MRSSTWRLEDLKTTIFNLGFVGENEHKQIRFDCKEMFGEYPTASPSLTVSPPEGENYPAVIERDGDFVIWTITDSDLIHEGSGEIQLSFTVSEVVAKSYIGRFRVSRSIMPTGEIPEGIDDFLTRAGAALTAIPETIDEALAEAKASGEFDGPAGPAGQDGTDGQDGYSPTATVVKSGKTATITITDKNGTTTAQISDGEGGGGGTSDYEALENLPQIGGVTLKGNKSLHDLGAAAEGDIPDPTSIIDDTAGDGDTDKVWSADKSSALLTEIHSVSPEKFGAKGDGMTDDSAAVQAAVDASYEVRFADNKTYYLASTVTIDHDCHLVGGKNTVIKTKTPSGGIVNTGIQATGTKRFDTTLTSDYSSTSDTGDNASNKFTFSNMTGIAIGDVIVIKATDQYYAYNRAYYYLGATLEVTDIYDGHIYTNMAMPWDITNTENVTVSVYHAPNVRVEKLKFVSDLDSITEGTYNACMEFNFCKNPTIVDCTISNMVIGLYLRYCVNAFVDNVQVSKSKYSNSILHDGYGIIINSCTNTYVQRVISTCAQSCLNLSGDVPNIDTYIKKVETSSEARGGGFGTHENVYNLTIEDSTFGGLNCIGRVRINRCRFFRNNRVDSHYAIAYGGLPDAKYADLIVTDCDFGDLPVNIVHSGWQSGIEAKNNMIGSIKIINCKGGSLNINPTTDEHNPANIINELVIDGWEGFKEIFHPQNCATIKRFKITNSTFTNHLFINDHYDAHGIVLDDIEHLDVSNDIPLIHKISLKKQTYGETILLPENTQIQLSSNNVSARFIVCGKNLVSDDVDDYAVGSVTGADNTALVRTPATGSSVPTIAMDSNGDIVYTQKTSTSKYSVYPVGMVYVDDISDITITATAVNSGETEGSKIRAMIAIVDSETGLIRYRGWGSETTPTSGGATVTHSREVRAKSLVMCYFYFSDPVSNAETTIKDITINLVSRFAPASVDSSEPYISTSRTGDGTLYSVEGLNHIMSSETQFNVSLTADYINSAGQQMNNASGVSF